MQVPRETSWQNHSAPGPRRMSGRRPLIPARGAARTASALGDADTGAFGGGRLRPMSFVRPDCCPQDSGAHTAGAPAAPVSAARTATSGGAAGRGFSDGLSVSHTARRCPSGATARSVCLRGSGARAAGAPAPPPSGAPAGRAPAGNARTAVGAGGRGFSDRSIQRRRSGLFHVEHDGAGQSASRTWRAESRPGAGVLADGGASRTFASTGMVRRRAGAGTRRPGIPARCACPSARRADHARRFRP
jgi:hypothetical protein